MVIELTDENFVSEVAMSSIPCIIGFTAGWCTMCSDLIPMFDELSCEFEGQVKFCIANIDQQKKIRIAFVVAALPYVVWVKDGSKTPLFDELVTKDRLKERIEFMLDGGVAPTTTPLKPL